jgi:hypothetical protein
LEKARAKVTVLDLGLGLGSGLGSGLVKVKALDWVKHQATVSEMLSLGWGLGKKASEESLL